MVRCERPRVKKFLAFLSVVTVIAVLCSMTAPDIYADDIVKDDSKIVILHTNDVHCAIDNTAGRAEPGEGSLGYECVAGEYKRLNEQYSCTTLVDAGDNIQGAASGAFSKGQWLVELMNDTGYEVSAIGNHEFQYGVERLLELTHGEGKLSEFPYVCCNFMDLRTGDAVFDPYFIKNFDTSKGEKKVAFVGVTTPSTLSAQGIRLFEDKDGKRMYGFCEDETGEALYSRVQESVDDARDEGADYVIILGHLGQAGVSEKWRSDTIAEHITGIDAVIDGHSHEQYIKEVPLKDGKTVPLCQTGTNLKTVGEMVIDVESDEISCELKKPPLPSDENIKAKVDEIMSELDKTLGEKIGVSLFDLYAHEDGGVTWAVRKGETNLGDLVSDSFRKKFGTDVAIVNGGSIRTDVSKGEISKMDIFNVFPFMNDSAVIEATGQQILDALEMSVSKYPAPAGSFLQVSGITYKVDKSIPSSVKTDDDGSFICVDGEYRVYDVRIGGEKLDTAKEYTVSGINYLLCDGSDGLTMFKGSENLLSDPALDIECVWDYVKEGLAGVIGSEYANREGQGRITFTDGKVCDMTEVSSVKNVSSGLKVSWEAAFGAEGYIVYRRTSASGKWKPAGEVSADALSFTDKDVTSGKKYYYTVAGYNSAGEGDYDKKGVSYIRLSAPSVVKLSKKFKGGKTSVTVSWKKISKASGYIVYLKCGSIDKKKTVKGAGTGSVTFSKLKKKNGYDVKVRSYRTVKGKKYYSACSSF